MVLRLICIWIFSLEGVIWLNQYTDDAIIDEHFLYNFILRKTYSSVIWVNNMESSFPINFFQNHKVAGIKIKDGRERYPIDVIERYADSNTPQPDFSTYSRNIADCTTNSRYFAK